MNNFINSPWRYTYVFSKSILTDAHWFQKFLKEDLSWVNGKKFFIFHRYPLMIIDNFNVVSTTGFPLETYSPLIIDADAMLSFPVTS